MKRFLLLSAVLFLFTVGLNISCTKDKTQVSNANCPDTISYLNQIKPIMDLNCSTSGCHDSGAAGGYDLTTYQSVADGSSTILSAIKQEPGLTPMPLGGNPLADSLIQQFECWIIQGKLDN